MIFVSCGLLGHPLRVETMADGKILEVVWASSCLNLQFDDKIGVVQMHTSVGTLRS